MIRDTASISTSPGTLHLFSVSDAGHLRHNFYDSTGWKPWEQIPWRPVPPSTRYNFVVELVKVDTARSLNADTLWGQSTLGPGNWPSQAVTQSGGGKFGGTHPKEWQPNHLRFGPMAVELSESVIFNYQILNKKDADETEFETALNNLGKKLVDKAIDSLVKALGSGLDSVAGVEITSVVTVPVIGPILALLESWALDELKHILFADCDGEVAMEQLVLMGRDLHLKTAHGPFRHTTIHKGTDSPTGCGANSRYEVTWAISRA